MISRRELLVLAGVAVLLRDGVARAAGSLDEVLARVAHARAHLKTLQGPFTQVRTIGLLATEVRSTGTLALVRPDRLRWELAPPDEVTFFLGPEGLAYRSPHGEARTQAASARIGPALDDLRTVLGGDLGRLKERWDLEVLHDGATGVEVEATAKAGATTPLHSLRFALAPDLVRPVRVVLVEGPRDKTVIEFGARAVDAPIDPAHMRP